ncbi:MAG: NifB/NifX family molybdenum-iron cluster-binding protein [Kiritimatiellae bacterium]|jgi:predicted Fe-Mo cluster-binding NifX family protein|nr:NifB/NifX family molybdenum-iron cluster-binding protein [Kiritimatiellia bacterium]
MKIAFSTAGDDLSATVDTRFGRAPKFLVYDCADKTFELIDNRQNLNAAQGAGIQSAQTVCSTGAEAVVTGHCGPKAYRALSAANIKVYNTEINPISAVIAALESGELKSSDGADVEGHW